MPRSAVLACLIALALAAPAQAGKITIGSSLSERAALQNGHPRDWAVWPTAFAAGGQVTAPAQGSVDMVTVKGTVLKADYEQRPDFHFMVVVLRPQDDGQVKLMVASEPLPFPFGGDDQRLTTFYLSERDEQPNLCVMPGDYVAIATSGGFGNTDPAFGGFPDNFYEDGYQVKMFGRVPGSTVSVFEQPAVGGDDGNGFQVGDTERGTERPGQELLMQSVIGTADDARFSCRSQEEQQNPTASLPDLPKRVKLVKGKVPLEIGCVSLKACEGTVYLKHNAAPVGAAKFSLPGRSSSVVKVPLNANGKRRLRQRKGKLALSVIVRVAGGKKVEGAFKLVR